MPLNPQAPCFVPRPSTAPVAIPTSPSDPFAQEEVALSLDEALELEEVQSWVEQMAYFEETEHDHVIELALRHADKSRIYAASHQGASHPNTFTGGARHQVASH